MEKDLAILIRRTRLTETSLVIHWCSRSHGIIKTVAKGARNPKGKFHGNLDLFYEAEIEIVRSRRKDGDLHILRDLAVADRRLGIRKTYARTLAAAYFVRLLEIVCERETPITPLFDLLRRGLNYLDSTDPDWKAILHFEKEATRILGLQKGPVSPIQALGDLFHRVPDQRGELRALLENLPPGEEGG